MSCDPIEPAREPSHWPGADLLRECSAGDLRTAFSTAYRNHSAAVYSLACRTCGPTLADDVTHEVFLRLWTHPEKFDATRGSLRNFLLTMGRYIAIDVIRSEKSRRARENRTRTASDAASVDVDHDLLRDERAIQVAQALNGLPLPEREAIATAFYGRRTYREAAIVLGEAEGTVKSRIRAGLGRLRTARTDASASTDTDTVVDG